MITSNCFESVCLCLRASSLVFLLSDDWFRDCSPLALAEPEADGDEGRRRKELGNIESDPKEKPVDVGGGVLFSATTFGLLLTRACKNNIVL